MGDETPQSLVEYRLIQIESGQKQVIQKIDELAEKFVNQAQLKAVTDRFDERLRAQDETHTTATRAVAEDLNDLQKSLEKGHGLRSSWWLWAAGAAVTISVTLLAVIGTAVVSAIQKYLETH